MVSKAQKIINYLKFAKRTSLLPEYQSFGRQLFEMIVVFIRCGIGPGGYLMADMGNKKYDWHYKLGFLNGRQYVRRINQINDKEYYPATFNKLIEKAILTSNAIPTPRMLGHLNIMNGRSCDGYPLRTTADLRALVERSKLEKLCFKLVSGYGGAGFKAVEVVRQGDDVAFLDLQEQRSYSVDEYYAVLNVATKGDFLVEQYLDQHPELSKFNPSSVNTLRVLVYQKEGEDPACLGAYLRIGREYSIVDNGSVGGMGAQVDLITGTLHAATYSLELGNSLKTHPDTEVPIMGEKILNITDAIELACEAVKVFPGISFAGVDVAIGKDGPVIIELNARADYVGFFKVKIPSRYALN